MILKKVIVDTRFTKFEEILAMSGVEIKSGKKALNEGAVADSNNLKINKNGIYLDDWHCLEKTDKKRWVYLGETPCEVFKTIENCKIVKLKHIDTSEGCSARIDFRLVHDDDNRRKNAEYFINLPIYTVEYEEK